MEVGERRLRRRSSYSLFLFLFGSTSIICQQLFRQQSSKSKIINAPIKWTANKRVRPVDADELQLKVSRLCDQYELALCRSSDSNLFERIRIESIIEFLRDSETDSRQAEKYLSMLEACVSNFSQERVDSERHREMAISSRSPIDRTDLTQNRSNNE